MAALCQLLLDPLKQANIRVSKEEQYQEGFLRDLFVEVFGYTLNPNPNYDLTTEFKTRPAAKGRRRDTQRRSCYRSGRAKRYEYH